MSSSKSLWYTAVGTIVAVAALNLGMVQVMTAPISERVELHDKKWAHDGMGNEILHRLARIEAKLEEIERRIDRQ